MNDSEVKVSDTEVGADLVGRDKNVFDFSTKREQTEYLKNLYEKFNKEKDADIGFKEICEELNYYVSQNDEDENIIGLENKLIAGNRKFLLKYAKEAKERFHKKLMKVCQYSDIAQDINVHILAKVKTSFIVEVYSFIIQGQTQEKINLLIRERVIEPVMKELGINIFKYTEEDIMGMVFFLTGNCHIKWAA